MRAGLSRIGWRLGGTVKQPELLPLGQQAGARLTEQIARMPGGKQPQGAIAARLASKRHWL